MRPACRTQSRKSRWVAVGRQSRRWVMPMGREVADMSKGRGASTPPRSSWRIWWAEISVRWSLSISSPRISTSEEDSTGQAGGVPAVGGAMDLVHGARRVAVVTDHVTKDGKPKLLKRCTLPLTGVACVKKVVTDLGVFDITPEGFKLLERAPGVEVEEIKQKTEGRLVVEGDVPEMGV